MFHSIFSAPSTWTHKPHRHDQSHSHRHNHSHNPVATVFNVKPFRMSLGIALLTTTLVSTQVFPSLLLPAQAMDFKALWSRFFKTDPPEPGAPGGTRDRFRFCAPKPGVLLDSTVIPDNAPTPIWSDRPSFVFEWKAEPIEIALYRVGESKPLWTQPMTEADQVTWVERVDRDGDAISVYHVTYNGTTILSAEEDYTWIVSSNDSGVVAPDIEVEVISEDEQRAIAQWLSNLETLERLNGGDEEAIALQRANYFADRGLWNDFWHEVMSLESPSEELQNLSEATLHWFCPQENSAAS